MDKDKLDKIIELLEVIKANQEANPIVHVQYPYYPQPYLPNPEPFYPQPDWTTPNWTSPAVGTGGNIYQC